MITLDHSGHGMPIYQFPHLLDKLIFYTVTKNGDKFTELPRTIKQDSSIPGLVAAQGLSIIRILHSEGGEEDNEDNHATEEEITTNFTAWSIGTRNEG